MAWLTDKLTRHAALNLGAVSDSLYRRAKRFTRFYENFNYDAESNGEYALLRALRGTAMHTIFDVGANIGTWSLAAARLFPQARVHAFEIVPATARQLAIEVRNTVNVTVNPCGLSDREGHATALVDASESWLSSIVPGTPDIHGDHFTPTPCSVTSGDAYCRAHAVDHINFLKLDVEGAEPLVLEGFRSMLSDARIDVIQFEYGMQNIYTKFLLLDFYRLLGDHGYAIGKLFPRGVRFKPYGPEDEDFRGPNFVAVNEQRPKLIKAIARFA